jgi:carboxyl-terminal processing protease
VRRFIRTSLLLIVFAAVFAIVSSTGPARAYAKERYQDLQIFAKVLNLVQQYYVEEVDTQKLIYGGIKGMLNELDPHTNFLPPDVYK